MTTEGEDKQKAKMPEFIYVDSGREEIRGSYQQFSQQEYIQSFQKIGTIHFPISIRFICLLLALVMFLTAAFVSIFVALFFMLNILTFFQAKQFWAKTKELWIRLKKVIVTAFGALIGVFSPAFGFSIILVYLMLQGGTQNEDWVTRIIRSSYEDD